MSLSPQKWAEGQALITPIRKEIEQLESYIKHQPKKFSNNVEYNDWLMTGRRTHVEITGRFERMREKIYREIAPGEGYTEGLHQEVYELQQKLSILMSNMKVDPKIYLKLNK